MLAKISRVLNQPFYCWLVAVYPILHLYSKNLGLVIDREVLHSLAWMLGATTLAFLLTNFLLRNRLKTAFMLGICSVFFSFSGHIYGLIENPPSLDDWTLNLLVALAVTIGFSYRQESNAFYVRVTAIANLIVTALLVIPCLTIISGYISESMHVPLTVERDTRTTNSQAVQKVNDSITRPDIYYVIPDGYPSDMWLQTAMAYDNSRFTEALKNRGFAIASHAQSNYSATLHSLASILNMQYFDRNQSQLFDLEYLRFSIADNIVSRQLQKLGYTNVLLLSGYLIPSPIADINRDFAPSGPIEIEIDTSNLSTAILDNSRGNQRKSHDIGHFYKQSFVKLYIDSTLLRVSSSKLKELFYSNASKPFDLFSPLRFLATIDEIANIAAMPEATFTIVHLMKPHRPIVFDEHGEPIDEIKEPSHQQYFAEFEFTNSKFLQMIDTILETSQYPPVIIFQADHGTTYGAVWTADRRLIHFDTYSALYLPDAYSIRLPMPYTLINTFPLVFNAIFGTAYELQENRLIELLVGYDAPFEQQDVTGIFANK